MKSNTLIFTGGHHTSALEVAIALKNKGRDIIWYGHRYSMWGDKADSAEYKEVVMAQIPFYDLKAGKFYRTLHPLKLLRIPMGFIQAFFLLLQHKPYGIVSFGGYLAVPVVICGWLLGIPGISHEQTSTIGWANRLISLFVKKIAVTWPSSLSLYPKHKVILVGLPLRQEILNLKSSPKLKKKNTIYITGGKQGSHPINEVVFQSLPQLLTSYTVIHQTGSSTLYNDYYKSTLIKSPNYSSFDYSYPQAIAALSTVDVVIGRAGAHTTYELGYLGKRCVLVPIPWVSHSEQDKNAQILVANNQAILLPESQLNPTTLISSIKKAQKLRPHPLDLPDNSTTRLIQLIESTLSL